MLMLLVESLRAVVDRQLEVLLGGGEDGFVRRWRSEDRDRYRLHTRRFWKESGWKICVPRNCSFG